jgi:uncharacterized membrane protein required for colicin V production
MFDIVLVLIAVSAAVGGYRLGFVARATSWIGFSLGVVAGALVLPVVLPEVQDASEPTVALVTIGLLVGMALIGNALGLVLGSRLHAELPAGALRRTDQVAGAVFGVVGLLVILWLLLPALTHIPGTMATQARGSAIAREVHESFPNPPDALEALRRIVGDEAEPVAADGRAHGDEDQHDVEHVHPSSPRRRSSHAWLNSLALVRNPVCATMRWSGRTDWPSMCQPRLSTSIVSTMPNPWADSSSRSCTAWVIWGV